MTKLDSVLKIRDITLLTNVCIVKAMVFPVLMYGCESWTIQKAEYQRTDSFKLSCITAYRSTGQLGGFSGLSWALSCNSDQPWWWWGIR